MLSIILIEIPQINDMLTCLMKIPLYYGVMMAIALFTCGGRWILRFKQ